MIGGFDYHEPNMYNLELKDSLATFAKNSTLAVAYSYFKYYALPFRPQCTTDIYITYFLCQKEVGVTFTFLN